MSAECGGFSQRFPYLRQSYDLSMQQSSCGQFHGGVILSLVLPGVELGGALKNVLAIGCGISDGLGFGCNGRAALITRGLSEMTRLAVALGAHPLTMQGLAGMGDLVLTCTGAPARLRTPVLAEVSEHGGDKSSCALMHNIY